MKYENGEKKYQNEINKKTKKKLQIKRENMN